ncbi:MAG: hypothetical protein ACI9DJ_003172 [Algoriphagus sp.]|jgi:hypothetical protein
MESSPLKENSYAFNMDKLKTLHKRKRIQVLFITYIGAAKIIYNYILQLDLKFAVFDQLYKK